MSQDQAHKKPDNALIDVSFSKAYANGKSRSAFCVDLHPVVRHSLDFYIEYNLYAF